MAKGTSSKPGTRRGKKPGASGGAGRITAHIPRPRRTPYEDVWDGFVDSVQSQMKKSLSSVEKLAPYHKPISVVQRMAYRFVIRTKNINPSIVSKAINNFRINVENAKADDDFVPIRSIRKPYKGSEFHWVLNGLKSAFTQEGFFGEHMFELETYDISRHSLLLQYALSHEVPPEYLIGFLFQCGTFPEISKKAKAKVFEAWYKPKSDV